MLYSLFAGFHLETSHLQNDEPCIILIESYLTTHHVVEFGLVIFGDKSACISKSSTQPRVHFFVATLTFFVA